MNAIRTSRALVAAMACSGLIGGSLPAQNITEAHRHVVIVLFDGFELLDATGPAEVFAHAGKVRPVQSGPAVRLQLIAPSSGVSVKARAYRLPLNKTNPSKNSRQTHCRTAGEPNGRAASASRATEWIRW